jgi:cysteine desulfurase / selenocysteine lyase
VNSAGSQDNQEECNLLDITTPQPGRTIYLNEATTSWPKAPGVIESVCASMAHLPSGVGRSASSGPDVLDACRQRLAALLGVGEPARIVLTMNATHALNPAIIGLRLCKGDGVVTTCAEHNSVLRPLYHLRQQKQVHLDVIGMDSAGKIDEAEFFSALEKQPSLVALTHASNVTGRVFDVHRFCTAAKAVGATTLVDASQSLGHIPVRPVEMNADIVAFPGHKALRGPAGTGGLYVAPGVELAPSIVGGTGILSESLLQPSNMPVRLESGTPNVPAFAGLLAALQWLEVNGQAARMQSEKLMSCLRSGLHAIPRVKMVGQTGDVSQLAVVSFCMTGLNVEDIGARLLHEYGIVCRTGLHCAPLIHKFLGTEPDGTVRFSLSGFTSESDVATALDAVEQIAS